MSMLDKNKIFFGLVHYILSEQKNVDWIIKSSLIDFTGISSVLEPRPYKTDNLLDEIIDYVKSIKPYHVQFSKYFEKYETATDTVNIPKNDRIEPTIIKRFDSIKSTSDIILSYYETLDENIDHVVSFEIIPTPIDSTVTIKTNTTLIQDKFNTPEYNTNGLLIFSTKDMRFYERRKIYYEDFRKSLWGWIAADINLVEGLYHETKNNSYYMFTKQVYNNGDYINEYRRLTDDESTNILNYHSANRLYKLGLHDNSEIEKELNANFKGLEINGSVFDVGKFGYDIFDYDTNDYDIPTIIYDYCIIDKEENFTNLFNFIPKYYEKEFTIPSSHLFKLIETIRLSTEDDEISVYIKDKNNTISELLEYVIKDGYIDIFSSLGLNKTLYIVKKSIYSDDIECQVIESYPFIESDSETIKRKFITKQDLEYDVNSINGLSIPNSIDSSKLIVQLKSGSNSGIRMPFMDYKIIDNKLFVFNTDILSTYDHLILTSFDYKYLYDKIYLWEDKFGRSNNIVNLDGNNFLRAIYEKGRPSELVVSQPNNDLFIYNTNGSKQQIFRNDFKNNMLSSIVDTNSLASIESIVYEEDSNNTIIKSIKIKNSNLLESAPASILVNSEIIEYNTFDKNDGIISNLRRGVNGSIVLMNVLDNHLPHSTTHKIGDIVIPYSNFKKIERQNKYISYNISDNENMTYTCPSGVKETSRIHVSKLFRINLLEDVTTSSDKIIIDSPNVVNNYNYIDIIEKSSDTNKFEGDFVLKINDDNVPFKSIYKMDDSKYCIENFTISSKYESIYDITIYDKNTSVILSSLPYELKQKDDTQPLLPFVLNEKYTIEYVEGSLKLDVVLAPSKKSSKAKNTEYIVKINDTDNLFTVNASLNNGLLSGTVFNIDKSIFGSIKNGIIIKSDGTIYGKIIGDKFTTIDTVVKLLQPSLYKKESIKINVIDGEFIFNKEEIVEEEKLVTLTFITDPMNAVIEIDGGEYQAFENTITVPNGTIVKYKASCQGYYDAEGSIVADISKDVLITLQKEIIIEDADYIVLRYVWTMGADLDTDTCFSNLTNIPSLNNKAIGWSRYRTIPTTNDSDYNEIYNNLDRYVCVWGQDNTGNASGEELEENILLNIKNIFSNEYINELPNTIIMNLAATWYNLASDVPIKLEIIAYKGGEMKFNNNTYSFYNVGGEKIKITDINNQTHDSLILNINDLSMMTHIYKNCGRISINKNDKSFKLAPYEETYNKVYGNNLLFAGTDTLIWLYDKEQNKLYKSMYRTRDTHSSIHCDNVFVIDESNEVRYDRNTDTLISDIYNIVDKSGSSCDWQYYYCYGIYSRGHIHSSPNNSNIYLTYVGHTNVDDTVYKLQDIPSYVYDESSKLLSEYATFINDDANYGVKITENNNLIFKNITGDDETSVSKECIILKDFSEPSTYMNINVSGIFNEPIDDGNGNTIYDSVYISMINNKSGDYINGYSFYYPTNVFLSLPPSFEMLISCSDSLKLISLEGNATIVSQSENNLNGCVINVYGDFQMNVEKVY